MSAVLDWSRHRTGPPRPCVRCGQPALMRDRDGRPCHKVCAEHDADAATDPAIVPDAPNLPVTVEKGHLT